MPSLPRALPNVKAIIIGCADMRVDPAHVLGIEPGEVRRYKEHRRSNHSRFVGAVGLPWRVGAVAGEIPGGGGELHDKVPRKSFLSPQDPLT